MVERNERKYGRKKIPIYNFQFKRMPRYQENGSVKKTQCDIVTGWNLTGSFSGPILGFVKSDHARGWGYTYTHTSCHAINPFPITHHHRVTHPKCNR